MHCKSEKSHCWLVLGSLMHLCLLCLCWQGSSLSTLLCCIFLGALERQHLFPLIPPAGEPQQRGALVAATSGARQASGAPSCSSSGPRLTGLASAAGEEHTLFSSPAS